MDELDGQAALSWHGLVAAARRQAPWLLGTAGLVVLLTLLFTLRQRPVYEARATLRVEEQHGQGNPTDLLSALQAPSTIETETEILRSRSVAEDVIDSLGLQGTGPAKDLREALRVTRPQANAAILALSYQSTDPDLAARVVNTVTRSYIRRRNEFQKQQAHAAIVFLEAQVGTIGGELEEAEQALEAFRRAHVVIDPQVQAGEQVRRLAELRARQEELTGERSQLRDLLARAQLPTESAGTWADFVGAPSLITSPAMSGIVQQLSTVEAERARLLTWRTPADPDVGGLDRTILVLRTRLAQLVESQLHGLDDAARSTDSTLARFDVALARVPAVELDYARLRRQVDQDTQLFTLLQTRLKESEISEAMEVANIQVVDPAIVPTQPVGPRRVTNLLFGTAGGLLLGLLVALVREGSDTRVRSRDEVVRLTELPLLAAIPRILVKNGHRGAKQLAQQIETRLVIQHSPKSPAAEAYRALRTNVAHSTTQRDRPLKTLVVTSPEPRDGKTTTAVNLAITLAEQGHRTVLVGADQRRPVLHKVFHVARAPGLSDLLSGTAQLDDVIHSIDLPDYARGRLDFIAAGRSVPNPAELLGSPATPRLLEGLAARYDAVVLDTPPLGVVTDAAVLATLADGVIFVARMGATHGEALRRAVQELEEIGTRIVGTVLTDVHRSADRHGYAYDAYYSYYSSDEDDGDPPIRRRRRHG